MKIFIPVITAATLLMSTAAFAQTTPSPTAPSPAVPSSPSTPPAVTPATPVAPGGSVSSMTEEQAKSWIDKSVYASDNKNVGDVAAIQRDSSGKVTEIHADVGGFLGIGTSRIRVMPSQFSLQGDRVVLNVPSDQVKGLPKVEASTGTKK